VELRERGKVLAELAGQSGLAELYSLVDELHLRRREEGLQAADLGYQEQLKALITWCTAWGGWRGRKGQQISSSWPG